MAERTLSEVYAGMLSRDWGTLLKIIEGGGRRIVISVTEGGINRVHEAQARRCWSGGPLAGYDIDGYWPPMPDIVRELDSSKTIVGWLSAPDDYPIDVLKSQYHGYMEG